MLDVIRGLRNRPRNWVIGFCLFLFGWMVFCCCCVVLVDGGGGGGGYSSV